MYLLDANVFITSKNFHYGFDFVPAFWDWLDRGHAAGILCSIDKIKQELDDKKDELTAWATTRKSMFLAMDQVSQTSMAAVAAWAAKSKFTQGAKQTFLSGADYQLIAYAHAHEYTVVTHERSEPNIVNRVKIPDACLAMSVQCIDPFMMLRNEGARFIL